MNNWLRDGQFNCRGGVSSAFAPDDLGENVLAWAKNVAVRGGKPRTRPAFIERMRLPQGRLQGISHFSLNRGALVAQIDGRVFRVNVSGLTFSSQAVPAEFINSPAIPRVWMQETDGSLVIQDGQSSAIIYDGAGARRSDGSKSEVPIGRQMAYGNGRLWVLVNYNQLVAGDIKVNDFQSELIFTETGYFNGGGAFYFPSRPKGLAFLPVSDSATGLGSLVISGPGFTDTIRAEIASRDLWTQIPGFRVTALPGIGAISHTAIIAINQDLYFRCDTGEIRSFRSARAELNTPGNAPISREVSRLIDFETQSLLEDNASAIHFDGRMLMTASPCFGKRGQVVFKDIISLDLSPLASNQGRLPPMYDGEWEGALFTNLVKGKFDGEERAFAVSCDADGNNRLWEIMKNDRVDRSFAGASPIKSSVEYRKFSFDKPNNLKRLELLRLYLAELDGSGSVDVFFRADNNAQWVKWDTITFNVKTTEAPTEGEASHVPKNLQAQGRSAIGTLSAPEDKNANTERPDNLGFLFQIRLVWIGSLQVDRIELFAAPVAETPYAFRDEQPPGPTLLETRDNIVSYEIPLNQTNTPDDVPVRGYVDESGNPYTDETAKPYTDEITT